VAGLEEAKQGDLPAGRSIATRRSTNMLMDVARGEAIALVDLDTVKPAGIYTSRLSALLLQNPPGAGNKRLGAVALTPSCVRVLQLRGAVAVSSPPRTRLSLCRYRLIPLSFACASLRLPRWKTPTPNPLSSHNRIVLVQFRLTASIEEQELIARSLTPR